MKRSARRLLTLLGPGGTGKTRLMLQVAEEVIEDYPDGVWLIELAPLTDPDLIPERVAAARPRPVAPLEDRTRLRPQRVRKARATREVLVLRDRQGQPLPLTELPPHHEVLVGGRSDH